MPLIAGRGNSAAHMKRKRTPVELTSLNVEAVAQDCLFKEGEEDLHPTAVYAYGMGAKMGFHPGRLSKHRQDVRDMLHQLPDEFMLDGGGGSSVLSAFLRKDGTQWGDHAQVDLLCILGNALDEARWMRFLPLEVLPGGVPFLVVGPFKSPKPKPEPILGMDNKHDTKNDNDQTNDQTNDHE